MRLMLTVECASRGVRRDVVVDYSPETTVRDLGETLLGIVDARRTSRSPMPANVIELHRPRTSGADTAVVEPAPHRSAVPLFLGSSELDPSLSLDQTDVRHGAVLGVGEPSTHHEVEPRGVVELRVISGHGAGRVHRLGVGSATIGTAGSSTIIVDDRSVPATAVLVEVATDGTLTLHPDAAVQGHDLDLPHRREPAVEPIVLAASTVEENTKKTWLRRRTKKVSTDLRLGDRVDPAAALPLVRLDREPLRDGDSWDPRQVLGVGEVLLERVEAESPDASLSRSPARPELDYNRPPRLHPAARPHEFSLPTEPRRPDKMPLPFIMMLSPLVMSGSMFAMTRSPYSLLFMLLMPMMMLLNSTGARRQQKRRYFDQLEEYHHKHALVEKAAVDSLVSERFQRRSMFPDPASLLLFATGPRARLWERRRWDPDFMVLRLGTADLPSDVIVKDPARAAHEGPLRWTAPDVPVTVPMESAGVVGVAGPHTPARRITSWMIAQAAGLHSPTDTALWIFTDEDGAAEWEWAKWLPHLRGSEGAHRAVRLAFEEDDRASMVGELTGEAARRREIDEKDRAGLQRILVVLDGARQLRMSPGMITLLKDGPSLKITFLCLDGTPRELPEECRSVIEVVGDRLNLETTQENHVDELRPDHVDPLWLERLSRCLAPVRDVSSEDLSTALPAASRLLDVLALQQPTGEELARRWATSGRTTRATIGEGVEGPFTIDVRADGPHGLVAGTTGSGKSELLQTIIASLAVGNRPDEFNFVLVDYKGGAAFKDCLHLPHTVGMVTDLDGHLTTRALDSLGAELRRREHQLADADAKDIEDYLAGRGADDEPMPRLLIIIDEFAALVAELPDFVTGLVDVARRGRSLGVHLILATQRPAGVVNAEIKSNTNLRIALRVTDKGDSDDVIESGAAAEIPKVFPGRAYARLGASSLSPFQSSRVGGRPRGDETAEVSTRPFAWQDLPRAGRQASGGGEEDDVSTPTDLATLVTAINEANDAIGLPEMRKPWLPPLPEKIGPDRLDLAEAQEGVVPPVPLGLSDIPSQQQQRLETWDIEKDSHLMIAGQSRSGRSSTLRLVAGVIARQTSPADVHLFGIDAGNNALLPLVALPHVGAVVTRLQTDRVNRLIGYLQRELTRRQQDLAEQGYADIREQRAAAEPGERLPYLVVLLDRLEGYVQAFESVDGGVMVERLTSLLQEGAGAGLRFVIASDRSGILGRMSMLVEDRIALSLNDPSDYGAVGLSAKQVPSSMPPGRAFRGDEHPREFQWALLDESGIGTDQVRALQEIGRESNDRWGTLPRHRRPQRVDELPVSITLDEAKAMDPVSASPTFIPVGVGGDTLAQWGFDPLQTGAGFLVAGPPRSGKSNVLMVMAATQARRRQILVIAPRVSPLRDLAKQRAQVFTGSEPLEEIKAALKGTRRDQLVLVDDFDVIGADSPLGQALAEHYASLRDSKNAMVVAANIDEVMSLYRGLPVDLKRGRTGLILAPRSASDGEVLNSRLPRSVASAVPVGRAVMTDPTGWRWVHVPKV